VTGTPIIHIDLDAVDKRLNGGELWIKGWGEWTAGDQPTCLHGAIRSCQPIPGDAYIIQEVASRFGFGIDANDDANDWPSIRAKVVPDITNDMLADTFGSQWEQIVALVRRAAVLTDDEVQQLAAAWAAAGAAAGAAGAAAWDAAGAAAGAAEREWQWQVLRAYIGEAAT